MDGEAVAGKLTDTCEAEQKGQREALELSLIHIFTLVIRALLKYIRTEE